MSLPLLFTLPPSNRHELILLDPSSKPSLKALNKQITSTIASSPNCAECMSLTFVLIPPFLLAFLSPSTPPSIHPSIHPFPASEPSTR